MNGSSPAVSPLYIGERPAKKTSFLKFGKGGIPLPWYLKGILIYLLAINLAAVILTRYDKKCVQQGRWRIPEATLLAVSALGGAPLMYLTMKRIRHKTRKKKFMIGIPVIFLVELLAIGALWYLSSSVWQRF